MSPESFQQDAYKQAANSHFDKLAKLVRVRSPEGARFVEFDFAIGDPKLFVELILPKPAFELFCKNNKVQMMTDEQAQLVDGEFNKWRYGEETLMAKNHDRTAS